VKTVILLNGGPRPIPVEVVELIVMDCETHYKERVDLIVFDLRFPEGNTIGTMADKVHTALRRTDLGITDFGIGPVAPAERCQVRNYGKSIDEAPVAGLLVIPPRNLYGKGPVGAAVLAEWLMYLLGRPAAWVSVDDRNDVVIDWPWARGVDLTPVSLVWHDHWL
jgi:hypothetical protein